MIISPPMSILLVTGKIYRCATCGTQHRVEFEDGAQPTQMSDFVAERHLRRAQELGQPHADPDSRGYYLYDLLTCDACRADAGRGELDLSEAIYALQEMLAQALVLRDARLDELLNDLVTGCNALTDDGWRELIGDAEFAELSGSHLLFAKKQRRLNAIFQHSPSLEKMMLARLHGLKNGLRKEPRPWLKEVTDFAMRNGLSEPITVFSPVETWEPNDLDYLGVIYPTNASIRYSVEVSSQVTFYQSVAVDFSREFQKLQSLSIHDLKNRLGLNRLESAIKQQAVQRFIGTQ